MSGFVSHGVGVGVLLQPACGLVEEKILEPSEFELVAIRLCRWPCSRLAASSSRAAS